MRTLLLLLLTLCGCVHGPTGQVRPLTSAEADIRTVAESEWATTEYEPIGERCEEDRSRMRIIVARTHAEMYSLTGYCGPSTPETRGEPGQEWEGDTWCRWGRAAAAYRRAQEPGVWPFALGHYWWPAIVLWHGHDEERRLRLIRHEAFHWLAECTSGDPDHGHTRGVFQ